MTICQYNPCILNKSYWFIPELLKFAEDTNNDGVCALMLLLESDDIDKFKFDSETFNELLSLEKNIINKDGETILMYICGNQPKLLSCE